MRHRSTAFALCCYSATPTCATVIELHRRVIATGHNGRYLLKNGQAAKGGFKVHGVVDFLHDIPQLA